MYQKNRKIALARDHHACRICGAGGMLETHHVQRRSKFGIKCMVAKHHPSNLMAVCKKCHKLLTGNVITAVATTALGTNGPVLFTHCDGDSFGDGGPPIKLTP